MRGKIDGLKGPAALSFYGRAGQSEWWVSMSFSAIAAALASAIPAAGAALALIFVVGGLAVSTRRLHDLDRSGRLLAFPALALASVLAVRGLEIAGLLTASDASVAYTWTGSAAALVLLPYVFMLGLLPGKRAPNRYGEADARNASSV